MLTAEEKLQHFSRLVFSQAQSQCDDILDRARQEAKEQVKTYEHSCLEQAYEQIQKQLAGIQRQTRESVHVLQSKEKKKLLARREAMVDEIFAEAAARIAEFHQTEAYADFLDACVKDAAAELGEGQKTVFLDRSDEKYLAALQKKFPEYTFSVCEESEALLGGARVVNQETRQMSDNSIATRIERQKETFLQTSGLAL